MKTLKDKEIQTNVIEERGVDYIRYTSGFIKEDVKQTLENFHSEYWKESYEGDKFKKHITCDELDYLLNKHFGNIIDIETLQELENE